jgi:tripartite-type tricarboxylate transporter receptor subunit TctC
MTPPPLRTAFIALGMFLACSFAPWSAQGEVPYPSRTIKFVVPYPPGGLPDTVARIVVRRLQERLNEPMVVENRPGANGGVAAAALVNSPADGYTFIVTDGTILSINPLVYAKLPYSPQDLAPIVLLARAPLFLAVHSTVPVTTMQEFIAYARARPGQLNYGSAGVGSIHHLSMEATKAALQLSLIHIPFKGTGESVQALLGGHVDAVYAAYPALSGAAEGGRVKLLATTGAQRSAQTPDLPALSEFIPGFDLAPMIGIFVRAGTPSEIVQKIASEAVAVVNEPDTVRQLAGVGVESAGAGPADFGQALKREIERVAVVVAAASIKPE